MYYYKDIEKYLRIVFFFKLVVVGNGLDFSCIFKIIRMDFLPCEDRAITVRAIIEATIQKTKSMLSCTKFLSASSSLFVW